MQAEHTKWRGVWNDCARYCLPNAAPLSAVTAKTQGAMKRQPVDTVGVECATKLAAWLYSSTVYSGEEWFSFSMRKKSGETRTNADLQKFLEKAARAVLDAVTTSNFNSVYQQLLRPYVVFGTGAFYSEFDDDGNLVCRQWPVTDDIFIAESSKGDIDTVFRHFVYTARQAVQEFGDDDLGPDIRKDAASPETADKPYRFLHCVFPRLDSEREHGKDTPENKPWASVYVEMEGKRIVKEGGYNSMPYQAPRFYNTGEIYGRGSAMSAIPALRSINFTTYHYINNVEAVSRPVVFAPPKVCDEGSLKPGEMTPYDSNDGKIELWSASGDLRSPLEFVAAQKESVRAIFYNDVFQYLEDRRNMTATEAQLRYDEMIQGISPVLANLQSEYFSPFLKRVFFELVGMGRIAVPTQFLDDGGKFREEFDVTYTTRLDTKLKSVLNANMFNALRMIAECDALIQNSPTAQLYVNQKKFALLVFGNNNVSADILNDDEEVEVQKEAMQAQAQQAALQGFVRPIDIQKTPEQGSMIETALNGGIK